GGGRTRRLRGTATAKRGGEDRLAAHGRDVDGHWPADGQLRRAGDGGGLAFGPRARSGVGPVVDGRAAHAGRRLAWRRTGVPPWRGPRGGGALRGEGRTQ